MKIDRLIGILTVLLRREKTTAPLLAERFEVSRKTILRDIDALCRAGIPVVTTQGAGGGIAIAEGYAIHRDVLTHEELRSLLIGLKSADSVAADPRSRELWQKLAPGGPDRFSIADHILIDLTSEHKASLSGKIARLQEAIAGYRTVAFDYYGPSGDSRREIEPYCVLFKYGAWYVYGFCLERQDFRLFKLDRLWGPGITDSAFSPREIPEGALAHAGQYEEPYSMQVLFDKSARFRLIEEYGPDCYRETDAGLLFTLTYGNKDYAYGFVLGFGDRAEVLAPPETRDEFQAIAARLYERYTARVPPVSLPPKKNDDIKQDG